MFYQTIRTHTFTREDNIEDLGLFQKIKIADRSAKSDSDYIRLCGSYTVTTTVWLL